MHTTNLDFLYVRVDKVLEGSVTSSYIIVGHPYNGSKRKLPDEILSGKYKWRFEISRFEEWNKEAATYVEEKDRGICKPVPVSGTTKELIDKLPKKEGETSNYFTCTINNWIEQAKGMEVEASSLASKGVLKAYFLSYGKKSPGKVP